MHGSIAGDLLLDCFGDVFELLLNAIRSGSGVLAARLFVNGPILLLAHVTTVSNGLASAASLGGGAAAVSAIVNASFVHGVE